MGLRHSINHMQPWFRIWFQNLKKDYPTQDGKGNLVNVRGSIHRADGDKRKLGLRYQFLLGLWKPVGLNVTCYDSNSDLQIYIAFFFGQLFLTFESAMGWYPKKKDGNYWNPMNTGFMFDDHGIRLEIWCDKHEWRSDGSNRIWEWHKEWPWNWASCTLWEVQREDGSFVPKVDGDYPDRRKEFEWPYKDGRKMYIDQYTYKLRDGRIQRRIATYHVSRMTWHKRYQKWPFMGWAKWPEMVDRSINVSFNDEVGERSGSWKGGCTGCSYEMLPGETPLQTLRRMEKERKFT